MKRSVFKIFFSLLVFIYVFSSVGVSLVAHYCGGELEKISLFSKPESCCDDEAEPETPIDDCCSNDSKYIAFQKDFTFYTLVSDCKASVQHLFIIDHSRISFTLPETLPTLFLVKQQNRPPNLVQDDIVLSSVLRI